MKAPFITRMVLYLFAMLLPLIHPAVIVPYDWTGWWMWFFLVPGEMLIAYFLSPPKVKLRTTLVLAGGLLAVSLAAAGFSGQPLMIAAAGSASFVLTLAVFKTGSFGQFVAAAEQFFLAYVYYKILNFSRASEDTARAGSGITQVLLFLAVISFLIHAFALYMSGFSGADRRRGRREGLVFGSLVPVLLLIAFVLPPDFVRHSAVFNTPDEDLIQDIPYDADGYPSDRGGRGDEEGPDGERGKTGELKGIPSDQWSSRMGEDGEGGSQYAVMLILSRHDPVYAAEKYFGRFDSVRGFTYSENEPLNELSYIRLLDTWQDENPPLDAGRESVEVRTLSTLAAKVLPYRPSKVEPTILKRQFHPFEYQYDSVSRITTAAEKDLAEAEPPGAAELRELGPYLETGLREDDKAVFRDFLDSVLDGNEGYYETVQAILSGFRTYQYELGFTDDVSVRNLVRFLGDSKRGDCTEFSNTTALLSRLAGVPSRVVTGYLASRNLQSPAHQRGILELRRVIEPLQEYPLESTYLVTTAHHHSWVQIYVSGYGWVDVETTSTALPPPPGFDPNSRDVVIPIIEDVSRSEEDFDFPWTVVLQFFGGLMALGIIGAYGFRFGREGFLTVRARESSSRGLDALYRLALMKSAAAGDRVKRRHETALEYAADTPGWRMFADAYTELRYRSIIPEDERKELWDLLREGYRRILDERQRGPVRILRRFFNLKGLYY